MSQSNQQEQKNYKNAWTPQEQSPSNNDNEPSFTNHKCYVTTQDHSVPAIQIINPPRTYTFAYFRSGDFIFEEEKNCIILEFTKRTVFIYGRNLKHLNDKLSLHKVAAISKANYHENDDDTYSYVEHIIVLLNHEVDMNELPKPPKK